MFVVPKSLQGLNIIYNPPELYFSRKALPLGCLASHFKNGSLLALHHILGCGDGQTDQVPNPTCLKNKLTFTQYVHNIDMQYEFTEYCFPIQVYKIMALSATYISVIPP